MVLEKHEMKRFAQIRKEQFGCLEKLEMAHQHGMKRFAQVRQEQFRCLEKLERAHSALENLKQTWRLHQESGELVMGTGKLKVYSNAVSQQAYVTRKVCTGAEEEPPADDCQKVSPELIDNKGLQLRPTNDHDQLTLKSILPNPEFKESGVRMQDILDIGESARDTSTVEEGVTNQLQKMSFSKPQPSQIENKCEMMELAHDEMTNMGFEDEKDEMATGDLYCTWDHSRRKRGEHNSISRVQSQESLKSMIMTADIDHLSNRWCEIDSLSGYDDGSQESISKRVSKPIGERKKVANSRYELHQHQNSVKFDVREDWQEDKSCDEGTVHAKNSFRSLNESPNKRWKQLVIPISRLLTRRDPRSEEWQE